MKLQLILIKPMRWLESTLLLLLPTCAHALVTCSISSGGVLSAYNPSDLAINTSSNSFTVTCSRDNPRRGRRNVRVQYEVVAGNGLNALGTQNRAALTGSFINYDLTSDAACTTLWNGGRRSSLPNPAARFNLAKGATVTNTYTYYGCIPPGQLVIPPEGTYTDIVTMSFSVGRVNGEASTFTGGTFPVSIIAPATCNFTTPPSSLIFNYPSFSPVPVLANTAFGVTCTTSLPYTMALDSTTGVIAGLNYSLTLNVTGTGGVNPLASTGTGVPQTFFVNGSIAASQVGICATANCSGVQIHTLTITY